jgi:hypothetical protein
MTAIVLQMRRIREGGNNSWIVVTGLEVVCEMATEAFELMTGKPPSGSFLSCPSVHDDSRMATTDLIRFPGRKAPKTLMRRVCYTRWERDLAPFEPRR